MSRDDIYAKLTTVFLGVLGTESIELSPETTAGDVEGWDSLSHIRIILAVEKKFDVRFATAELTRFENIGQLVDMIEEKQAA